MCQWLDGVCDIQCPQLVHVKCFSGILLFAYNFVNHRYVAHELCFHYLKHYYFKFADTVTSY